MPRLKQDEVERIAAEFAKTLGFAAPYELAGSAFYEGGRDEYDDTLYWNVYFCGRDTAQVEIGLSCDFLITIDDVTGEASFTPTL